MTPAVLLSVFALLSVQLSVQSVWAIGEKEFLAPSPEERVKAEGGSVHVWSESFQQLQDTRLGAALITVEPKSLALPEYTESPTLLYVLSGRAKAGLITPVGIPTSVRYIEKGDIWAIPQGWVRWIYNDDDKNPVRLVGVAETSRGPNKGQYTPFHLIGAKKKYTGGFLHGFSKEILAHAWDVEEEDIQKLLEGQKEAGFVKVEQEPDFIKSAEESNSWFGDFVYSVHRTQPEVSVEHGGKLALLNAFKLPILKQLNLGFACARLEPGALMAPHFVANAARVIFITKGKGGVEMAYPDGSKALDADLKEGDVIVIPLGYPTALRAHNTETLEYASFAGNSIPIPAFLAGANSLYKAVPLELSATAFSVDKETLKKFRQKRLHEFAIFPPREGGKGSRKESLTEWVESHLEDFQNFMEQSHGVIAEQLGLRLPSTREE